MTRQAEELTLQREETSKDMRDYTVNKFFVEQKLNSFYDSNLDFDLKFLKFNTNCTCDSDICDEINSFIPLVFISFACMNPLLTIDCNIAKFVSTIIHTYI